MFLAVQVALAALGLVVMTRGRFRVGDRSVTNPIASLVGIILTAQLPLALLIGIVLGLTDEPGPAAAQSAGPVVVPYQPPGQPVVVPPPTVARDESANWWVDPLITCMAMLMAAGVTAIGMRADDTAAELLTVHRAASELADQDAGGA